MAQFVIVKYDLGASIVSSLEASPTQEVHKCSHCHKVLSSLASLKRHVLLLHDPSYNRPKPILKYSCEICGKSFPTPSYLERHMPIHTGEQKYECEHCKKRFTQNAHYKSHLLSFHTPGGKKYNCTVKGCEYKCVRKNQLTRHLKLHSQRGTWTCEQCGRAFASELFHRRHMLHHADPSRRYRCEICGRFFPSEKFLKQHEEIHTQRQELRATCQACHATFRTDRGFRAHAQKKCGRNAYEFKCDECPAGFRKEKKLASHKRLHNPVIIKEKGSTHVCRVCRKRYTGFKNFRSHSKQTCGRKAYPYNCNKCTRNFFTERSLKIHERKFHEREIHERKIHEHKVHKPKICERKIGECKSGPKIRVREIPEGEIHEGEIHEGEIHEGEIHEGEIHEGEIHEGEIHEGEIHEGEIHESLPDEDAPEFKCGTCANTNPNLQGLQDHVSSSSHEAATVFCACKVCHKKCLSRAELEEHGVSHTIQGQRSRLLKPRRRGFSCRKCSMTCSDMSDLLSHITAEHALAFICHICGERFKKNQEVEAHVTSKHNK